MYLFSFLKALFKPRNILPTLYFIANAVIIFFIFYILPIEIIANEIWNPIILGIIGLGVNALFILISLSPLGELFWRIRNRVYSHTEEDLSKLWQNAIGVFEEVKEKAMASSKKISSKVKIYYSPTEDLNAYALGHRTVILTRGMLYVDSEYIKGVLAHELGHILNGDSDLKLGINVSNSILTIFLTVFSLIANFIIGIFQYSKNGILSLIGTILNVILNIILIGLFKLWTLLGVLCINWTSRKQEYLADSFAKEIGYGENLAAFLYALDGNAPKTSKFSLMFQTHPDTPARLSALGYANT